MTTAGAHSWFMNIVGREFVAVESGQLYFLT